VISFRAIDKIEGAVLFRAATIGALGPRRRDCRCAMSGGGRSGGERTRERSRPSRRGPAWDQQKSQSHRDRAPLVINDYPIFLDLIKLTMTISPPKCHRPGIEDRAVRRNERHAAAHEYVKFRVTVRLSATPLVSFA